MVDKRYVDRERPASAKLLSDADRCGAMTRNGTPCQSRKGSRTDHVGYGQCDQHGGNTEAGIKSAMAAMGADLITQFKTNHARFGGDRRDPSISTLTPEQALLEEVRRSAAMVRFLEERIAMWGLDDIQMQTIDAFINANPTAAKRRVDGQPSMTDRVKGVLQSLPHENPDSPNHLPNLTAVNQNTGIQSFTEKQAWLNLYREERGHLTRTAKMCIDAGVATRLVTIAEDQGRILSTAIRAVLVALNLSPQQAALVPEIVPQVLRAVASDQPIPNITSLALGSAS